MPESIASVHGKCAEAIRTGIEALDLRHYVDDAKSAEPSGGSFKHMIPDENDLTFPCTVVYFNAAERQQGMRNRLDLIGFPVHVLICDRKLTAYSVMPDWITLWRERIAGRFRNQRLAGVTECDLVEWEPDAVIDEKIREYLFFASSMTFICWCRMARG